MLRTSLLGGFAFAFISLAAMAADFPQWRGPDRDGKVPALDAPDQWPQALTTKWTINVGQGDSGPVVVGDSIYTFTRQGSDEVIACYETETGKEKWKNSYPTPAFSGPDARQHAGPRATPAVSGGKVVTLGVIGTLSCVDASDGKLAWRKDEVKGVPKFHTASSPLITNGMCIVQLGSADQGGIYAFDLNTGETKWQWIGEGPDYASPVVMQADGGGQVVALTPKKVVGVSLADGKLLWSTPWPSEGRNYNAATPVVNGNSIYLVAAGRGMKSLRIEKGDDNWNAVEVWSKPDIGAQFATPVLVDARLYGLSDKGSIYCVDAAKGETLWTDQVKRGGYGAVLTDGAKSILLLTEKGELIAFAPDAKEFKQLASYKVSETPTYATPAITGPDGIYIKAQDTLSRMSLK